MFTRLYILATLSFWSVLSNAQLPIKETPINLDGQYHGSCLFWLDSLGQITNEKESAVLYRKVEFYNGRPLGKAVDYYVSNTPKWEGYFIDGLNWVPNGDIISYYPNGKKKEVYSLDSGKVIGTYESFYEMGEVKSVIEYVRGKREGQAKNFYRSGQLKSRANYFNGVYNGEYVSYYPEGFFKKKGFYNNGEKVGQWKYYDVNGELHLKTSAHNTEKRESNIFSYNGLKEKTGDWKIFLNEDFVQCEYQEAKYVMHKTFKRDYPIADWNIKYITGEKYIMATELKSNYYKLEKYHLSSQLNAVWYEESEKKTGKFVSYYLNGQLAIKGKYKADLKIGKWTNYFENGQLKSQEKYNEQGLLNGVQKYYYESGQINKKLLYVGGKPSGNWVFYAIGGGILRELDFENNIGSSQINFQDSILAIPQKGGKWFLKKYGDILSADPENVILDIGATTKEPKTKLVFEELKKACDQKRSNNVFSMLIDLCHLKYHYDSLKFKKIQSQEELYKSFGTSTIIRYNLLKARYYQERGELEVSKRILTSNLEFFEASKQKMQILSLWVESQLMLSNTLYELNKVKRAKMVLYNTLSQLSELKLLDTQLGLKILNEIGQLQKSEGLLEVYKNYLQESLIIQKGLGLSADSQYVKSVLELAHTHLRLGENNSAFKLLSNLKQSSYYLNYKYETDVLELHYYIKMKKSEALKLQLKLLTNLLLRAKIQNTKLINEINVLHQLLEENDLKQFDYFLLNQFFESSRSKSIKPVPQLIELKRRYLELKPYYSGE